MIVFLGSSRKYFKLHIKYNNILGNTAYREVRRIKTFCLYQALLNYDSSEGARVSGTML